MKSLRLHATLRLFGLAAFSFGLLSALGGSDPWFY